MKEKLINFKLFNYEQYFFNNDSSLISDNKDDEKDIEKIKDNCNSMVNFFNDCKNRFALLRKRQKNGFFSTNSDFKYESSDEEESKNPRSIQNIDLLFKFSS